MSEQVTIFDELSAQNVAIAKAAADRAIDRADDHADDDWKLAAQLVLAKLAYHKQTFTTDDVHQELEAFDVWTHDTRALGSLLRKAARLRFIEATPDYRPSARKQCHGRPVRVWRSLKYRA